MSGGGCRFAKKSYFCSKIIHHISECHNNEAEDEKVKLAVEDEVQLNNEQVELAFDSWAAMLNMIKNAQWMVKLLHIYKIFLDWRYQSIFSYH